MFIGTFLCHRVFYVSACLLSILFSDSILSRGTDIDGSESACLNKHWDLFLSYLYPMPVTVSSWVFKFLKK